MKKILLTLVTLSMLISTNAQADWFFFGKVKAILNNTHGIAISLDVTDSTSPCTTQRIWLLEYDHPRFDQMYPMLLAAQASGQPGRIQGTNPQSCSGSYQNANNFMLGAW